MKVSKQQLEENRINVLRSASRLFRERGLEAVTLDDVMKDAGLTRGAFYGHFKSKDDLIAQATAYAVRPTESLETLPFADYVARYLSARQRDNSGDGCAFAALASEIARQPGEARRLMSEGFEEIIARMSEKAPGETPEAKRSRAIATMSGLVGALILARMSGGEALSDEILEATKCSLVEDRP